MNPSAADSTGLKYPPATSNPLLSFLLNHTMTEYQAAIATQTHKQIYQQQQRAYVNALVDVTVQAIASIWPNALNTPPTGSRPIANLSTFLHHILKHSRTTHSTLQLAIFYLFRIRQRVLERRNDDVYIACGRRMFLAALICAHKFLQDKTYKNSAWSKVSGLSVTEVNHAERIMLQLLDWSLYVKKDTYDQWIRMLQTHLKVQPPMSDIKDEANHQRMQQGMATAMQNSCFVNMAKTAMPTMMNTTLPTPAVPVNMAQHTVGATVAAAAAAAAAAATTVSASTPKTGTVIHLGMPTPVEELKSSIQYHDIYGLVSPPDLKRKRSPDAESFPVKRRT